MTTNEAVRFIELIITESLKQLKVCQNDPIVVEYTDKCHEALALIKADLKHGYIHYTGEVD